MSSFEHLFKNRGALKTQEERREELLSYLKKRRTDAVDEKRKITDLFNDDNSNNENDEEMELEYDNKTWKKRYKTFYNRLMLSEWLKDIPNDLEQNWLIKLCPKGSRNLVVAAHNITVSYSRLGVEKCRFESYLPGGGGNAEAANDKFTVLDCIYDRKQECYYVLDVLAYNSLSVKKCDADFRFFWLKSKFEENNELQERSTYNRYPFTLVNFFPAELPLIESVFSKPFTLEGNEFAELDGILFYHRKTHYINGITPLVGWLKAYMVPEMLNVPVHESYMHQKPENYISLAYYLENKDKIKGKKNRSKKGDVMET